MNIYISYCLISFTHATISKFVSGRHGNTPEISVSGKTNTDRWNSRCDHYFSDHQSGMILGV